MTLHPIRCLRVVLEGVTVQEALKITHSCATLIARANLAANFTPSDSFDIVLYCHAAHVGIVTNGTLELNINKFNHVVNNTKIITEAERSMLLDLRCTNFDCFLQPCNVAINQLKVILINQTQGHQRLSRAFAAGVRVSSATFFFYNFVLQCCPHFTISKLGYDSTSFEFKQLITRNS